MNGISVKIFFPGPQTFQSGRLWTTSPLIPLQNPRQHEGLSENRIYSWYIYIHTQILLVNHPLNRHPIMGQTHQGMIRCWGALRVSFFERQRLLPRNLCPAQLWCWLVQQPLGSCKDRETGQAGRGGYRISAQRFHNDSDFLAPAVNLGAVWQPRHSEKQAVESRNLRMGLK